MHKPISIVLALMLCFSSVVFAEHGRSRSQSHNTQPQNRHETDRQERGRHENGGRENDRHDRDRRISGPENHRRIRAREDVRYREDRREIFFEGIWFGCDDWPVWVFVDPVYFVEGPQGIWFIIDFENPTLMVPVYIVE